jgi:hypothetical protein
MVEPPATFRPPPNASKTVREAWRQQMQDWLAQELDREHVANMQRANAKENIARWRSKFFPERTPEESAIEAAWEGDMEPLRRLHPELAPFLHPPKRPRGPRPNPYKASIAKLAAGFVPRIRKFWQREFGMKNRSQYYEKEISAEAFAAAIGNEWFGPEKPLTFKAITAAAKPSGGHKQPRRKSRVK